MLSGVLADEMAIFESGKVAGWDFVSVIIVGDRDEEITGVEISLSKCVKYPSIISNSVRKF